MKNTWKQGIELGHWHTMLANTSLRFSELFAATSVCRQSKNLKEEKKCSDFFMKASPEGMHN